MQPGENTPTRAALAFQLVAALDLYTARLDELDACELHGSSLHLIELTEAVRSIRIQCAAFPGLSTLFVELLIGHSELVSNVGQRYRTLGPSRRRQRAGLIAAQRRRVQDLLRRALEPLAVEGAANDEVGSTDCEA